MRAPAYLYLGIRRDTVAMAIGRGHTAYGRYAQDVGANPLDALSPRLRPRGDVRRGAARACERARSASTSQLVTTEGSARQHGRGIARAILASELGHAEAASMADGHAIPGDASHESLPGLRAPVAADAQGELRDPKKNEEGMYDPEHLERAWRSGAGR